MTARSPDGGAQFRQMWPQWARLVRLAVSRGARTHDAEDLASESILRVVQSQSFDDSREPWPYLARTLLNLIAEQLRRDITERKTNSIVEIPRQRRPEDEAIDSAIAVRELQRLRALESPETVWLVIDYVRADLTWVQLGHRHGISATAARKRVDRALRRLRYRSARPEVE